MKKQSIRTKKNVAFNSLVKTKGRKAIVTFFDPTTGDFSAYRVDDRLLWRYEEALHTDYDPNCEFEDIQIFDLQAGLKSERALSKSLSRIYKLPVRRKRITKVPNAKTNKAIVHSCESYTTFAYANWVYLAARTIDEHFVFHNDGAVSFSLYCAEEPPKCVARLIRKWSVERYSVSLPRNDDNVHERLDGTLQNFQVNWEYIENVLAWIRSVAVSPRNLDRIPTSVNVFRSRLASVMP